MNYEQGATGREAQIVSLMQAAFAASDGAEEASQVAGLSRDLLAQTPPDDLRVTVAVEGAELAGAILWSRLRYSEDPRGVFLLSPVAVAPSWQRRGVGQGLITHGLGALRAEGVAVAITYGDPAYYSRVGFAQIPQQVAQAPLPLSLPHGWLGQSLEEGPLAPLQGACSCVPAMNRPEVW